MATGVGDHCGLVSDRTRTDGAGVEQAQDIVARKRRIQLSNLPKLGHFLTDSLAARTERGVDGPAVVYLDCVAALLDHHHRAQVFKFLHVVGQKLDYEGVSFVASLDTTTVDEETTLVLSEAFDDRIRPRKGTLTGLLD